MVSGLMKLFSDPNAKTLTLGIAYSLGLATTNMLRLLFALPSIEVVDTAGDSSYSDYSSCFGAVLIAGLISQFHQR